MKKRIASLDFLKYVLAVMIVFHHFQQITGVRFSYINFWEGKIYFGHICEFFFMISGFMAALNLSRTKQQTFIDYIKRPLIRIYPMVIINTVATVALLLVYRALCGRNYEGFGPGFWRVFSSLFLIFSGGAVADVDPAINQHLWYLCVLVMCYILVWVICFIASKLGTNPYYLFALMCFIGLGGVQYEIDRPFLNNSSARGYASFFLGMLIFLIYEKVSAKVRTITAAVIALVVIMGGIANFDIFFDNSWAVLTFILFPSIMLVMIGITDIFKGKIWTVLGQTSFELYLWHLFGLIILQIFMEKGIINSYYGLAGMLIFTIIISLIAFLIYNFVEKPVTKWLFEKVKNAGVVS